MTGLGEISGISIHLDPVGSLISKDQSQYYSFTASSLLLVLMINLGVHTVLVLNIIVGRLGVNTNATITNGKVSDYRDKGAAFYTSGSLVPFQLTTKAINNIINRR